MTLILLGVVWWLPFCLFLLEGRAREALTRLAPRLFPREQPRLAGDAARPAARHRAGPTAARTAYVEAHPVAWRGVAPLGRCGVSWSPSSGGGRAAPWLGLAGFALAATGVLFDATAESIFAGWMPERMDLARTAAVLSGAFANGLYCVGGLLLTVASGRLLAGWRRAWTYATWTIGLGLTVAAILGSVPLLVAFTAATMTSFLGWLLFVGRRLA
jgi:hypothetical protein